MDKNLDKRVVKTKRNLYQGLLEVMQDKTFEEIKISDICNKAMTNRSTFYDHFDDKYELLTSLMEDLKQELILILDQKVGHSKSIKEHYMNIIEILLNHITDNINIYNPILKKNNNSIVIDMLYDTLYKDLEEELKKEVNYMNIPTDIISKFYGTAVTNICLDYIRYPKKYKKEELMYYLNTLIPEDIGEEKK